MFGVFSPHQLHFKLFFEMTERGSSLMLKGILFHVLRAEYENPFLAYSR